MTDWTYKPVAKPNTNGLNLEVNYKNPQEYIRCMYDLMFLALQTDSTRFITYQTESEQSSTHEALELCLTTLGYKGATHDIAHKRPKDYSGQWDQWRNANHAYFLQRLKDAREGKAIY